ncbi:hypothetical protein XELAEV_18020893mg [Xenopus laevis]|uniref:Uncharacterized protein n=1 Tax=Xenopus laevis TaxID=8355 RepID=A0A974HRG1_XENLA|nr:hypothetical protein XELAEV_18020893mg [Xenopus laevis]
MQIIHFAFPTCITPYSIDATWIQMRMAAKTRIRVHKTRHNLLCSPTHIYYKKDPGRCSTCTLKSSSKSFLATVQILNHSVTSTELEY